MDTLTMEAQADAARVRADLRSEGAEVARILREACSRPLESSAMVARDTGTGRRSRRGRVRCGESIEEIQARLSTLDKALASCSLNTGNTNGKTVLHFACQYRSNGEGGARLVETMLELRADVNATTSCGCTPLFFAAARGHNDTVRMLLNHGANPCVVPANGETAAQVGFGRLAASTQDLLKGIETSGAWPWHKMPSEKGYSRSFTHSPGRSADAGTNEKRNEDILDFSGESCAGKLDLVFLQALEDGPQAASRAIINVASKCTFAGLDQDVDFKVLSSMLRSAITQDVLSFCAVIVACSKEVLENALHSSGQRDRRPIRKARSVLIDEIYRLVPLQTLNETPVDEICKACDRDLAFDITILKVEFHAPGDHHAVEMLWTDVFESNDRCRGESLQGCWSGCRARRKRGERAVMQWTRFLRFAYSMRDVTTRWHSMIRDVCHQASVAGCQQHLLASLRGHEKEVPAGLIDVIDLEIRQSYAEAETREVSNAGKIQATHGSIPSYELQIRPVWIEDDDGIDELQAHILAMICEDASLVLGIDTEWGDFDGDAHGLSIVQLSAIGRAWIVDVLEPRPRVLEFLWWLFTCDQIVLLGFAFVNDMEKLLTMFSKCSMIPSRTNHNEVLLRSFGLQGKGIDLQLHAMQRRNKGDTPGLKSVVREFLGLELDKTFQCSNWILRPLSDAQLRYAASDAAVLLDVAVAMGIESAGTVQEK